MDHQSTLISSVRVWLFLGLILSHHCSTTYAAALKDRENAERIKTEQRMASFFYPASQSEETTTTTTTSLKTNSSSPAEPEAPAPTPAAPVPIAIAAGVSSDHASGDLSLAASANHQNTLNAQNSILSAAEALSMDVTHRIISPFVWVNNRVSQAAGTLPAIMAANGALLGTAIAVPIQTGALAANHLAAAATGTLVTVPISLVSGGGAGLLGALESAREFYHTSVRPTLHSAYEYLPGSPLPVFVRPAAVIGGAQAVVGGMALGVVSNSVHSVAEGVESLGDRLAGAGEGIAQWGDSLVLWAAVPEEQLESANETSTMQVESTATTSSPSPTVTSK